MLKEFILSWYFVVIFICSVFFVIFRKSISKFIANMKVSKSKYGLSVGSEQLQTESPEREDDKKIAEIMNNIGIKDIDELDSFLKNTKDDLQNKNKTIEEKEGLIKRLFDLVQFYDFSYLNLYFVFNSKLALLWFYNQGLQHSSTKDLFSLTFPLPPQIQNSQIEKEAIFAVLTSNNLLNLTENGTYKISPKGEQFLKFIKFIL